MTKIRSGFSFSLASAMFILLLCFVPGALGQSGDGGSTGSSSAVSVHALPGLLVLTPNNSGHHDNNGCAARGRNDRSKCTAVPEGGTAFAYLSLVALGCLATGIFRSRRQARLRQTE